MRCMVNSERVDSETTPANGYIEVDIGILVCLSVSMFRGSPNCRLKELLPEEDAMIDWVP